MFGNCNTYLAAIGAISLSYFALKAVCFLWRNASQYFLARLLGLSADLKSFGSWAVVTGSTDGIGKAYAFELAQRGLNVVLISRSLDKLNAVAQEIERTFQVKTKCIVADFTGEFEIYENISKQLAGIEVGVLVNNVGVSFDHPEFFTEISDMDLRNVIQVNCNAVTFMTKMILPQMVERHKGAVINVSSSSALVPQPLLAVYSASKAYVDFLSRAVQAEYKSKGIIVQSVVPAFVVSKLSKFRRSSFFVPDPTSFARSALATVGVATRTCGWWTHTLQHFFSIAIMPEWLYHYVSMKALLTARHKALKKQNKTE